MIENKEKYLGVKLISMGNILIGSYFVILGFYNFLSGKTHLENLIFTIFLAIYPLWLGIATFNLKKISLISNKIFSVIGIMMSLAFYFLSVNLLINKGYSLKVAYFKSGVQLMVCFLTGLYFLGAIFYLSRPAVKEQFK